MQPIWGLIQSVVDKCEHWGCLGRGGVRVRFGAGLDGLTWG